MSGAEQSLVIYQPNSPTVLKNIIVYGKASSGADVEIFVNGISQGSAAADASTGAFVMKGVLLNKGENYLTGTASDSQGNTSPLSDQILVKVILSQPTDVTSLSFKNSDFSADFTKDVAIGDSLYMELAGTDADPSTIDSALITLTS